MHLALTRVDHCYLLVRLMVPPGWPNCQSVHGFALPLCHTQVLLSSFEKNQSRFSSFKLASPMLLSLSPLDYYHPLIIVYANTCSTSEQLRF